MALLRQKTTRDDPAEIQIPRLTDDARYAEALGLLNAFRDHQERLERERDRLVLRHHLGAPDSKSGNSSDRQLRARLAKLEAEAPVASVPAQPTAANATPAIARGIELLSGQRIPTVPDHGTRMNEIDHEIIAIRAAIFAQVEVVDGITSDLSYEASKQLRPEWNRLQLVMYRAAQELAAATDRVRAFQTAIISAGIKPHNNVIRAPNSRVPLLLGSETEFTSEISSWRRTLEALEILR